MKENKRSRFFEFALLPTVLALAWPTMLEELMQTAVQYIDTAMVGSLGTAATAAVGSTTTVNWLIGSTVLAFGVGFLAFISQALGAGEKEKAQKAAAQSVLAVLIIGAVFTALTLSLSRYVPVWMQVDPNIRDAASRYFFVLYLPMLPRTASMIFGTVLRSAGDTKTPMRIGIGVNAVNVILITDGYGQYSFLRCVYRKSIFAVADNMADSFYREFTVAGSKGMQGRNQHA